MKLFRLLNTALITLSLIACSDSTNKHHYGVFSDPDDFVADPVTGCLVAKYYLKNNGENLVRWYGECIDGFAIGKGRLVWRNEDTSLSYHYTCLRPEHRQAQCNTGASMR